MVKFLLFLQGYYNYGINLYPFLFPLSVILYLVDITLIVFNNYNTFTIIGFVGYCIFFLGILIGYILEDKYKLTNG